MSANAASRTWNLYLTGPGSFQDRARNHGRVRRRHLAPLLPRHPGRLDPRGRRQHDAHSSVDVIFPYWYNVDVRRVPGPQEKPLHWVGASKRDFLEFPESVKDDMGNALGLAQFGGTAPNAKPWKGLGAGVLELVESHDGNAYRSVYTVRFPEAVYVLHAFQKKSPSGIRTSRRDVELVAKRFRAAQHDYEEHYGTP
jgi:phage-related protein